MFEVNYSVDITVFFEFLCSKAAGSPVRLRVKTCSNVISKHMWVGDFQQISDLDFGQSVLTDLNSLT